MTTQCEKCNDTGIITEIHGEDASEYEVEFACECQEDLNKGLWTP